MLRGRRPVGDDCIISLDFGEEYSKETIKKLKLKNTVHQGIDFDCPKGTPIIAYRDGIIQIARDGADDPKGDDGYGKRVWLYCDVLKEKKAVRVLYGHLSRMNVVVGQRVKEGDMLGLTGDSGKCTKPHLHFGMEELPERTKIRPLFYLNRETF